MADAEAIVIAARQPEMRFVAPKTADQQAKAVLFRGRERLVHQRTELVISAAISSLTARSSVGSSGRDLNVARMRILYPNSLLNGAQNAHKPLF